MMRVVEKSIKVICLIFVFSFNCFFLFYDLINLFS